VEGSAIGLSPAGLIASSAGGGTVYVSNIIIDGLDIGALDRVAKDSLKTFAEQGSTYLTSLFDTELAKAPLRIARADTSISLAGGTLRVGPATVDQQSVHMQAFGSANLKNGQLEGRVTLASANSVADIGEKPQAAISWAGTPSGLARRTDFGTFTAAVTDRAIEIEQAQTRAFEDDLRERAMFNRRLKADRALIAADLDAKLNAERDAVLEKEGERIRLNFERISLEATARQEKASALQEFDRERRRALGRAQSVAPIRLRTQTARQRSIESILAEPLNLAPDAAGPIDLSPPQTTQ
jgi:hypothetical protein